MTSIFFCPFFLGFSHVPIQQGDGFPALGHHVGRCGNESMTLAYDEDEGRHLDEIYQFWFRCFWGGHVFTDAQSARRAHNRYCMDLAFLRQGIRAASCG